MASKKFLKELDIHFISLVKAGANKKQIIYKSAEHEENPVFTKFLFSTLGHPGEKKRL